MEQLPSRSKGTSAGKQEMLRHSVRSAGRAARAQVHFKVMGKKRHRAHCRSGQGLRGAAAGTSRARLPGSCRQLSRTAGHSPSWLPYPQWWDMVRCAALLYPWRLSQRPGPNALSGAFIGSRQLHALRCGRRRGGE